MELTTEWLEDEALFLLLGEDLPVSPFAAENLLNAIHVGLIELDSVFEERKHIDQSVKAGRQLMTFTGAVA